MNVSEDETEATSWLNVWLLFFAGVAAATLFGKVPIAVPVLQQDLDMTLFEAGLAVAIFSIVAAACGATFGAIADRAGAVRVACTGIGLAATASLAGAFAQGPIFLLVTRVGEGIGFFLAVSALPALILKVATHRDRQKAMGLWGAFLPIGSALVLIFGGGLLEEIGWYGLWYITSAMLIIAGGFVLFATRDLPKSEVRSTASLISAYSILKRPGPLFMSLIFMGYALQFQSVTAFVPSIFVEDLSWSLAAAGLAGGVIVGSNAIGNLVAGVALDAGFDRKSVLIVGCLGMMVGAIILFIYAFPVWLRLAGGVCFSVVGGCIPAALFSGAPVHAASPSQVSTVNGLLFQGAAFGQLVGPPLVIVFVQFAGHWSGILYVAVPAALFCIYCASRLGALEKSLA